MECSAARLEGPCGRGHDFPAACRRRLRPRERAAPGPPLPPKRRPPRARCSSSPALGGVNLATPTQGTFGGSLVAGKATDAVFDLSLDDAIARGLRQNLGLILQASAQQSAHGQQMEQLQALLPTVTGDASIEAEQIDLAAFGLKIPGLNPIIGPFQVVDFRAYLTQSLINVPALESYIAAKHNFAAAKLTAEDAREMVVLTVGNALPAVPGRRGAHHGGQRRACHQQALAGPGHGLARRRRQSAARRSARAGGLPERAAGAHLHHQPVGQGQAGAGARHRAAARPGLSASPTRSPTPRWTTWIPQLRLRRR